LSGPTYATEFNFSLYAATTLSSASVVDDMLVPSAQPKLGQGWDGAWGVGVMRLRRAGLTEGGEVRRARRGEASTACRGAAIKSGAESRVRPCQMRSKMVRIGETVEWSGLSRSEFRGRQLQG